MRPTVNRPAFVLGVTSRNASVEVTSSEHVDCAPT
jgi:hypothetical protein